jgi:hypothetical protein
MYFSLKLLWTPTRIFIFSCLFSSSIAMAAEPVSAVLPVSSPPGGVIVIGFVGGRVAENNAIHREVQLATRLRKDYPTGMQAEIFRNRQGRQAHEAVLHLLDTDRNGTLSDEEKHNARIVLYGHSWGASEAITLARGLQRDGVPVLLTIQVDSVEKRGEDDRRIPVNVVQAINFYQQNGLLRGRREIQATDRLRTQILGNFKLDYSQKRVSVEGYPWYAQIFMKPHIEIESDPTVWGQIESLIRSKVAPAGISK